MPASLYDYEPEPYSGYVVRAEPPSIGFYVFVAVYTVLAFALIAPLVAWSKIQENRKRLEPGQPFDEALAAGHSLQEQQLPPPPPPPPPLSSHQPREHMGIAAAAALATAEMASAWEKDRIINGNRNDEKKLVCSKNSQPTQKLSSSHLQQQRSAERRESSSSSIASGRSAGLRSFLLRELDQSYPDKDPDFQSRLGRPQQQTYEVEPQPTARQPGNSSSKAQTENSSEVPSAATTTQLHHPANKRLSKLVLDVNGRRWKHRRPIGRVDVIQNAIAHETTASSVAGKRRRSGSSAAGGNGGGAVHAPLKGSLIPPTSNRMLSISKRRTLQQSQRGMSDVASSILSEQHHQLHQQPNIQVDISQLNRDVRQQQILQFQQQQRHPAVLHRLQAMQRQQYQRQQGAVAASRRGSKFGGMSTVSQSERSAMSSIVDDISPNDAADANDPGRGNVFVEDNNLHYLQNVKYRNGNYQGFGVQAACLTVPIEGLLKMAYPDDEKWRVLRTSFPLALGAGSESLFRLITAAFVSQYLGTESMVAFLLVGLFVRLTSEELSGAIVDALSSFVQVAMYSGAPSAGGRESNVSTGMFIAGQYVQLACIMQCMLQIPVLFLWAVFMEPIVNWFVDSTTTAAIAEDYTFVVIFAYLVQSLSRTLTAVFHICGHEHFESIIDIVGASLQVITIACVVALVDNVNLTTVAYIQVLITVTSAMAKIAFPVMRGWMRPFRRGLILNFALIQNKIGICQLLRATGPLVLGTVLEYGEWELLTIFVRFLGPAEVASWVLLGTFWDFLQALTEGIGEAAANQVAFLLSVGQPQMAKELSYSAVYISCIQSLIVTSALLMSGQYLAVLFTTDPTIQHLVNNAFAMLSVANIAMAFSQINWSLVGAQGRFRLATLVVFYARWLVTMPVAAISIFAFSLNLNAVSGALVVGYSTASCALSFILLSSDWGRLAGTMQGMNTTPNKLEDDFGEDKLEARVEAVNPVLGELDLDDFDDSSDSSEGFGLGGPDDEDESGRGKSQSSSRTSKNKQRNS